MILKVGERGDGVILNARENITSNLTVFEEKDDLTAKKYYDCNITLKTVPSDNVNKLI